MLGLQLPAVAGLPRASSRSRWPPSRAGPPSWKWPYFGPTDGINRAGRPAGVTCTLRNLGGQLAENVTATLTVPAGVKVLDGAQKKLDRLSLYLPKNLDWRIQAEKPGKLDVRLEVSAPRQNQLLLRRHWN